MVELLLTLLLLLGVVIGGAATLGGSYLLLLFVLARLGAWARESGQRDKQREEREDAALAVVVRP